MTSFTDQPRSKRATALRSLRLLTLRDLKVRYSTSLLGYLWSILDPLAMSLIYWFIFTQMMQRSIGETPYIVFLLCAMLPWMWFNGAVSDSSRAFLRDVKLVRSVALPRWIWVARIVCSKGIEFLLSLPVLALFAIFNGAEVNWRLALYPLAIVMMAALVLGVGLILAPLVVFFRDLERATKLILRVLFYASPVIYGIGDLPDAVAPFAWANPLSGIFALFRAGFFPDQLNWTLVGTSAAITTAILLVGMLVFRRSVGGVLKEL
ncbi:ABC transporter permease [Leucobacter sp. UT-8R-CII-1-4]|uniref:ABC transporter permease n=1 Tax=Leucobacter sp. UT-8R-CII-1-4 TaxID=3040075 RepID=UPI0024A7F980|nr:ABC transporter permease [Leucobacter sp. UT-8R-CII-1-4]MDI6023085.1 ABC transporter permease [Leucobacter sp. UT-8R-CII-1-4]